MLFSSRWGLALLVGALGVMTQPLLAQEAGVPSKAELKKQLTPLQYAVTQEGGTERPSITPTGIIISRGSMSISCRAKRSLARRISSIREPVGRALPNHWCRRMCAKSRSRMVRPRCARARRTRIWATNSTMVRRRRISAIASTRRRCVLSRRQIWRRMVTGSLRGRFPEKTDKGKCRNGHLQTEK